MTPTVAMCAFMAEGDIIAEYLMVEDIVIDDIDALSNIAISTTPSHRSSTVEKLRSFSIPAI